MLWVKDTLGISSYLLSRLDFDFGLLGRKVGGIGGAVTVC